MSQQQGKNRRESIMRRLGYSGRNRLGDGAREDDHGISDDLQGSFEADNTGRGAKRNQSRSPPDQKPKGKRMSRRTKDPLEICKEEIEKDPRLLR